jgi:hypothetical protein
VYFLLSLPISAPILRYYVNLDNSLRLTVKLPQKGIVLLTYIFNGIIRISYWPKQFKISQIITIVKPGKVPTEIIISSNQPSISIIQIISDS